MKMNEDLEKEFTLSEESLKQVVARVGGTVVEAEGITVPTSPVEEVRPEEGKKTSGEEASYSQLAYAQPAYAQAAYAQLAYAQAAYSQLLGPKASLSVIAEGLSPNHVSRFRRS
ncbi:hypothetical protein AXG93_3671s1270 [Marchantia polymorpha subsp. ruderalis]|uniref:Uncharacterized protein n=1 Tax=Marchantia polymorpha subsp. ruderalis TaxID=1480154 RepID=A0A176WGN5_MARPO|nr:hypothetical protein AXG93_3671s1270 [Marchantia polymorpha subsp. ruderalis]